MAQEVPDIDLILGGHDHIIYQKKIENSLILKSGENFHDFHVINLDFSKKICKPTYEFPKYYVSLHAVHVDESFQENKELKEYALSSTKASIDASSLLTYLTTTRLGDGKWKGTTHAFILHWQDQVKKYHNIAPGSSKIPQDIIRTMLENAVHPFPALSAVKA